MSEKFQQLEVQLKELTSRKLRTQLELSKHWDDEITDIIKKHPKFKSLYFNVDSNDGTLILSYINSTDNTNFEVTYEEEGELYYNREGFKSKLIEDDIKEVEIMNLVRELFIFVKQNREYLKYFKGKKYLNLMDK